MEDSSRAIEYKRAALIRDEHLRELLYNKNKENVFALEDDGQLYDYLFGKISSNVLAGAGAYYNSSIVDENEKYLCQMVIRGEWAPRKKMDFSNQIIEISFYSAGMGMMEKLALKRSTERTKIFRLFPIATGEKTTASGEDPLSLNPVTLAMFFSLLYQPS